MLPLLAGAGRLLASGVGKRVAGAASKKAVGNAAKKISKDKFFNTEEKKKVDTVRMGMAKPPISPTKLLPPLDIKDPPKEVDLSKGNEDGGIKDTFNKIDDTLNGIISYLNSQNQFKKKESEDSRKRAELENKKRQENKLESKGKSNRILPSLKLPGDTFGIGKFFKNILIGGLILAIMNNLQSIIQFFKDTYNKIKEIIEKLGEFLSPIWDGLKWIVGEGIKLVAKMLGIPPENVDDKDILKNLNEIKDNIPFLKNLFDGINKTIASLGGTSTPSGQAGPSSYAPGTIPESVSQDTEFTQGVTQLAQKYNVPEDYLYAVMGFETGGTFDPAQKNAKGSEATGLIQFKPSTAEGLGTTTEALSKMTRSEQLTYVDKYFASKDIQGGTLSDLYMAVLLPAAVGKSEDYVLFGEGGAYGGQREYEQNKGLDLNNDGKITKAEATSKVAAYLPQGFTLPTQQRLSTEARQIQSTGTYTVSGVTYSVDTGKPIQTPAPAAPAQVKAPAKSTAASLVTGISESADYEMPGGMSGAILMPIQSQGGSPTMSSGGGGGMIPVGISKKEVLNSLYQAQLVGFLYKQG